MTSANSNSGYNDDNFKNDIFISYPRAINQSTNQSDGWVSQFHSYLSYYLSYHTNEPEIFRDEQMEGNDKFPQRLCEEVEQSALFLALLSPTYMMRPWCQAEAKLFFKITRNHIEQNHYKSRVFKVLTFLMKNHEQMPQEFQDLNGTEFFEIDVSTKKIIRIDPDFGERAKSEFLKRIDMLAGEIANNLKVLRRRRYDASVLYPEVSKQAEKLISKHNFADSQTPEVPVTRKKMSVYLAETNQSFNKKRNDIKRDLEMRGYTVIPESSASYYTLIPDLTETDNSGETLTFIPDLAERVNNDLRKCIISVHIFGDITNDFNHSIIKMQYEAAVNYGKENIYFSQIVWNPNKLQVQQNSDNEHYFDTIKDSSDFLQTSFEELKSIINDRLDEKAYGANQHKKAAVINKTATTQKEIYLIYEPHDNDDDNEVIKLFDYLYEQEYEVLLHPSLDIDFEKAQQDHQAFLLRCDAVLIYWGNSSELWVREKLDDLQNSINLRSANPILAKILYIATPETNQKKRFRTRQVGTDEIKKNFADFAPADLEYFLSQLA